MSTTRRLIEEIIDRHGSMTMHELRERTDVPLLSIYPCVDRSEAVEIRGFEVREV